MLQRQRQQTQSFQNDNTNGSFFPQSFGSNQDRLAMLQRRTHTVVSGESLWSIAIQYDVSIAALRSANQITGDSIHVGEVLTIPTSANSSESSNVESTQSETSTESETASKSEPAGKPAEKSSHDGYNAALGKELAAASMAETGGNTTPKYFCYRHVANAVDRVIGSFLYGNDAFMAASQLAAKKDLFTEISASNLSSLPAGAIVVWGKGNSDSGHISISQGNGMETSDFIGPQMTSHYGGASARVFLPKSRMR